MSSACPSLDQGVFWPSWFLPISHLQTGFALLTGKEFESKVEYHREFITAKDGVGSISVDFTPKPSEMDPAIPIIVVSHGIGISTINIQVGGSHESYVHDLAFEALFHLVPEKDRPHRQTNDQVGESFSAHFRVCVVNFRGCAKTPLTSPQLYNASFTGARISNFLSF